MDGDSDLGVVGLRRTLALTFAVGALVLLAVRSLPITAVERPVIRLQRERTDVILEAGRGITQEFRSSGGVIAGVRLFSRTPTFGRRQLAVRVLTRDGRELARGSSVRRAYRGDLMELTVRLQRTRTEREDPLLLEMVLGRGDPLPLTVSRSDLSRQLQLRQDGEPLNHDLLFSVLQPAVASAAVQRGAVAGVVVLLGAAVLLGIRTRRESRRWVASGVLLAIVAPLALWGFLSGGERFGVGDWDFYFSLHEALRRSVLIHHAFPFWNPVTCGGTAGLADPEFPGFTPTFLLELLFGVPVGLRLSLFLTIIVGSAGMLALSRRLGLSPQGALLAALGTFFGSVNLLELVEGHVNLFAVMWLPWVLWAWLGAYGRTRNNEHGTTDRDTPPPRMPYILCPTPRTLACALFLTLMFFQGGVYLLAYTGIAFLILPFLVARPWAAVRTSAAAVLWTLGLSAFKLIPVLFWLREFPDETYAGSTWTLPYLHEILLGRHLRGAALIPGQGSGWHEYGAYVGPLLLLLSAVGLWGLRRSRLARGLMVATVLAILLSSAGPLLKPLFDIVPVIPRSNISRVILVAVIPLSLLAGLGLDRLRGRWARDPVLAPLLVGLVAVDLLTLAAPLADQAFTVPSLVSPLPSAPPPIAFSNSTFPVAVAGETFTRTYAATLQGYGTLAQCAVLGPPPLIRGIEDEDMPAYVETEPRGGTAELLFWSPNRVRVRASVPAEADVVLNTNVAPGWTVNGRPALSANGRVGVRLPAGTHELLFVYRPPGFALGMTVTIGALVTAAWQVRRSSAGRALRSLP